MPQTLLLRLPLPGHEDTEWLLVDDTGTRTGPRQRGALALAAAVAKDRRVVLLVPATQVLLAEPELPPGSAARLLKTVPFALEEQLTEDIDKLHFAVGSPGSARGTPVAVVSRALLNDWLSLCGSAGLLPAAIYADASLLPANPGQTVLWLEDSRLAVRRPSMLPVTVDASPLPAALQIAGVVDAAIPENVLLYATQDDWNSVQEEFSSIAAQFASINVQILPEGPLVWLARQLPGTDAINLLQGEFSSLEKFGSVWRRWRLAAMLAGGLLIAHLLTQALQIREANRQSDRLDAQLAQLFSATMPGETPTDPRRQMQIRLERVRASAAGPEYFLRSLQSLSAAVAATPHASIDALSYREQTLDLKVTATDVDGLAQLSRLIAQQGLAAEIQSSTPAAGHVEGRLQIRAAGTGKRS